MTRTRFWFVLAVCTTVCCAHALEIEGFTPDEYLVYKSIDGVDLELHVFHPPGYQPTDNRAAIVFFFGGGWSSGSPTQFHPHCEYLAERGMVAMSADYRVESRNGTTPAECVKDGKSAIRWIRQHAGQLGIDANRLAAGGGSAGGHVAAATAALPGFNEEGEDLGVSCIPSALVLFNPVIDNGPDGYGYSRVQDYWEEFSPLHNIHRNMPPTVFFLGTSDNLIPVSTALAYQRRMEVLGGRCDLHLYEGREHGFFNYTNPEDYAATVAEMDRFLVSLGFLQTVATGLAAAAGDGSVSLDWDDYVLGDLDSYTVYRSTNSGSYSSALVTGLTSSDYTDNSVVNGTTYYYVVTIVDTNANESVPSAEVSATPAEIPYVNEEFDFGTDPGKITPTNAGFTNFVTGGHTITDVADAVRYTAGTDEGHDDFGTLKNYGSLGQKGDFTITMEAALVTAGQNDKTRWRYGIAMFNDLADLHETGIDALLLYDDGDMDMLFRGGLDGTTFATALFKNIGGTARPYPWPEGEQYTFEVRGTHSGTDLELVFTLSDGAITKSLTNTVNAASYSGTYFGVAARIRNAFTVDFDSFSVNAGSAPAGYLGWASGWNTNIGAATNDFDFDGLNNFYEYGLDGNPTNGLDQGTLPVFSKSGAGFRYVHPRRSDDTNLIYWIETTTNLVSGTWANEGYTVIGTSLTGGTLDFITNSVDTAADERYIRLKIEEGL